MGVMEQLRRELDAAGVRYVGTHTVTASGGGVSHTATERDGLVSISTYRIGLTPEQAARVMRSEL